MPLKRSSFDKAIFRKDLTRFAPVMVLYTLCLLLGLTMMYMDGGTYTRNYWFAHYMCQCINVMALVNLFYAPIVAMLLFGDLFNSRMCNALHAMPLTRETFFFSHTAAALVFSLVPTLVMALVSIPLLLGTRVTNAWLIALLWYLGTNLEYLCFLGIAVFCVFCAGNRLSMGLIYAGLNSGATLVTALVDILYTPVLHGVTTSTQFSDLLTPIIRLANGAFVELEDIRDAARRAADPNGNFFLSYWVNPEYARLVIWALVGVLFLLLGLHLYRRRELECAGDAVAFRFLGPVYQVGFSLCTAVVALIVLRTIFGSGSYSENAPLLYLFLLCGLAAGWFAAKMFLSRNIRVFQLRNWKGLGILALCLALTLTLTYFDVFRVDDWVPKVQNVRSVTLSCPGGTIELTEESDIRQAIRLQELALEDRVVDLNICPLSWLDAQPDGRRNATTPAGGFWYRDEDDGQDFNYYGDESVPDDGTRYDPLEPHASTSYVTLSYTLTSGREVSRYYRVWNDEEEGTILRNFMSRWDVVWNSSRSGYHDEPNLERVQSIRLQNTNISPEYLTAETLASLLDAVKADCAEGHMAQSSMLHTGYFRRYNEQDQKSHPITNLYLYVNVYVGDGNDTTGFSFDIYPDSTHTLQWLKDHDLFPSIYTVYPLSYSILYSY